MADWLKLNHSLVRSPKIRGLMRALRCKKHAALGLAVAWLCWVDEQTTDGQTGLSPDELDEEIGFRGCAEALISIGWAALGVDGLVYAVEFGKHCGATAKKRALDNTRKANQRARDAELSRILRDKSHAECHADCVSRIEENNNSNKVELSSTVDVGAQAVPCSLPQDAFSGWLRAVGGVVPMLGRLNLERPLPRAVEAAARVAAGLVPMTDEVLELLRRYYAADSVQSYRPDSLVHFFENLPDVLQHAANWCRKDDVRRRKAAATERRKVLETQGLQVRRCAGVMLGAEAMAFIRGETDELGG